MNPSGPIAIPALLKLNPGGINLAVYSIDFKPQEKALALEIDCTVSSPAAPAQTALRIYCSGVLAYTLLGGPAPAGEATTGGLVYATDHPALLSFGPQATVFCTAPLPDPQRFFFDFYRLVQTELSLSVDPARYLNGEGDLGRWLEFVYSRAYRLMSGPQLLVERVRDLLDAQAAQYEVLPDAPIDFGVAAGALHVLTAGNLQVVCSQSTAEWE